MKASSDKYILLDNSENGMFNFSVIPLSNLDYERLVKSLNGDELRLFLSGETVYTEEYGKIRRLLKVGPEIFNSNS